MRKETVMQGMKIVTMRGETYVFTARPGTPPVGTRDLVDGTILQVTRGPQVLGIFPVRNVEAILPIIEIDGEVAS